MTGGDPINIYTLSFLFFLLPIAALVCVMLPTRFRTLGLLFFSLYFYVTLSPLNLGLMLACVYLDFVLARVIARRPHSSMVARTAFTLGCAKNVALFVACSTLDTLGLYTMPLGVVVYAFTSLGYLADVWSGETEATRNPYEYGLFCCFFGKLYVGPIVAYNDFHKSLASGKPTAGVIGRGVALFLQGLVKKLVLADGALAIVDRLLSVGYLDVSVGMVWLLVLCDILGVYFLLSGFSDMAQGLGLIFGLALPANFRYPLQADSVTDFFSRFNISANRFLRKYVYTPLGAEDSGKLATMLNMLLVAMLMGLWYGVSLNFLIWGASLGLLILAEMKLGEERLQRVPTVLRRLYTLTAVGFSFVWYVSPTPGWALFYLRTMLGAGGAPAIDELTRYLLGSHWLLLLIGLLLCTSTLRGLAGRFALKYRLVSEILSVALNLGLLTIALAYLV